MAIEDDIRRLEEQIARLRRDTDPGLRGPDNQPINPDGSPRASDFNPATFDASAVSGQGGAFGTSAGFVTDPSTGNQTALSGNVEFNPEEFFVSEQAALDFANLVGEQNIGNFLENFDRSRGLAFQNLDTEITGLEQFLPRSNSLIRAADTERNDLILQQSDRFDSRNQGAAARATEGNVAIRQGIFEQNFGDVFGDVQRTTDRNLGRLDRVEAENDRAIDRNSSLAEGILPDALLNDQLSRTARNRGADVAAAGGFGVNSAATRNLLDRVDLDTRLGIQRQGEQALGTSLDRLRGLATEAQNIQGSAAQTSQGLFNSVLAPGIVDFQPIQALPTVTDVGGQIRPTPTNDAATIQRSLTGDQTQLNTLSPGTAFQGSLGAQEVNSNVGLKALEFEQGILDKEANAVNNVLDLNELDDRIQIENDRFEAGLDSREDSQQLAGITQLGTTLAGLLTSTGLGQSILGTLGLGGATTGATTTAGVTGATTAAQQAVLQAGGLNSSAAGGTLSSLLGPVAGIAAGAATGLAQFNGVRDFLENNELSPVEQAALFLPTFGFSAFSNEVDLDTLGDFVGLGSGKSEDQQFRDGIRSLLQSREVIDNEFNLTLADGSSFDVGIDGDNRLENLNGANLDGSEDRAYYEADFSNPLTPKTIGFANPLGVILTASSDGVRFAGHLTNAIQSNTASDIDGIRANAQSVALSSGLDYGGGIAILRELNSRGEISDELFQAYSGGWFDLWLGQ